MTNRSDFNFSSGIKKIRPTVKKGIIARKNITVRIEKTSANPPTRGVIIPPVPKARPIMRLDIIDLPLEANFCAMTTPNGRVAMTKNPVRKPLR